MSSRFRKGVRVRFPCQCGICVPLYLHNSFLDEKQSTIDLYIIVQDLLGFQGDSRRILFESFQVLCEVQRVLIINMTQSEESMVRDPPLENMPGRA